MNRLGKVKLSNHRVGKHLFAISKGSELLATDSDRDDRSTRPPGSPWDAV